MLFKIPNVQKVHVRGHWSLSLSLSSLSLPHTQLTSQWCYSVNKNCRCSLKKHASVHYSTCVCVCEFVCVCVCVLPSMALLSAEQSVSLCVGSNCWPTGQFHGSEYANRLNASYTDRHQCQYNNHSTHSFT